MNIKLPFGYYPLSTLEGERWEISSRPGDMCQEKCCGQLLLPDLPEILEREIRVVHTWTWGIIHDTVRFGYFYLALSTSKVAKSADDLKEWYPWSTEYFDYILAELYVLV